MLRTVAYTGIPIKMSQEHGNLRTHFLLSCSREFDELSSKGEKVGEQLRETNMQAAAAQSNRSTSCAGADDEEEDLELSGSADLMIDNDDRGEEKKEKKESPEHNCV